MVINMHKSVSNHPEGRVDGVLEPCEWQALYCRIHKTNIPSSEAPTLGESVRWIAKFSRWKTF